MGKRLVFASVALFLLFERSSGTGRQPRGPEDATIPAPTPPLDGHADDRARDFVGDGGDMADPAGHHGGPFSSGSASETVGRIRAARLSSVLGQQVIIQNIGGRPGN